MFSIFKKPLGNGTTVYVAEGANIIVLISSRSSHCFSRDDLKNAMFLRIGENNNIEIVPPEDYIEKNIFISELIKKVILDGMYSTVIDWNIPFISKTRKIGTQLITIELSLTTLQNSSNYKLNAKTSFGTKKTSVNIALFNLETKSWEI